ncbi:MAG TPA: MoaD/ThiS family protein [Candidatus Sulfotelmatobacter sp.]|jgi:sulfur-carrier protein
MKSIVRIELPANLRLLASVGHEVNVSITGPVTQRAILDALEADYPMLQGTIRDHTSKLRRPFIRFFASEQDLSHVSPDDLLPDSIVRGLEPFLIIGAIAGG